MEWGYSLEPSVSPVSESQNAHNNAERMVHEHLHFLQPLYADGCQQVVGLERQVDLHPNANPTEPEQRGDGGEKSRDGDIRVVESTSQQIFSILKDCFILSFERRGRRAFHHPSIRNRWSGSYASSTGVSIDRSAYTFLTALYSHLIRAQGTKDRQVTGPTDQ